MVVAGMNALDFAALILFLLLWTGYAPFVRWRGRRVGTLASAMVDHRHAWMDALLGRDMKVADTAIVGHIMSTAGFFASTTVIVIGALLGVLVNIGRAPAGGGSGWWPVSQYGAVEIKIVLILVVAVYAFQSFTWSIRQANFAAVTMGAAPQSTMPVELRQRLAAAMGSIITGVAESYDSGLRAYYFALAAVTWLLSPVLFMLASIGVVVLLMYRQTRSNTALALQKIAAVRAEATRAAGSA